MCIIIERINIHIILSDRHTKCTFRERKTRNNLNIQTRDEQLNYTEFQYNSLAQNFLNGRTDEFFTGERKMRNICCVQNES